VSGMAGRLQRCRRPRRKAEWKFHATDEELYTSACRSFWRSIPASDAQSILYVFDNTNRVYVFLITASGKRAAWSLPRHGLW